MLDDIRQYHTFRRGGQTRWVLHALLRRAVLRVPLRQREDDRRVRQRGARIRRSEAIRASGRGQQLLQTLDGQRLQPGVQGRNVLHGDGTSENGANVSLTVHHRLERVSVRLSRGGASQVSRRKLHGRHQEVCVSCATPVQLYVFSDSWCEPLSPCCRLRSMGRERHLLPRTTVRADGVRVFAVHALLRQRSVPVR